MAVVLKQPKPGVDEGAFTRKNNAEKSKNKVDRETYKKDGLSRCFHGVVYQLKLTLLFMKRGANKQYKFRMATERTDAGKFDDIEFQYIDQGQQKYRMIQVKHRYEESEKITSKALETVTKGDFSIKKYFVSYRDIKQKLRKDSEMEDLIIFTNIDLEKNLKINNFDELTDKDDILDISLQRGKRFKLKLDCKLRNNLVETLRDSSELKLLTKELENCLVNGKIFDLNNKMFKKYQVALAHNVIDVKEKKISLRNEVPQYLYTNLIQYQGKTIEIKDGFGIGIDKNPQLTDKQTSAIIKIISDAFANNKIDLIKIPKSTKVAKLAGHVFVEGYGKIKFRNGFFTEKSLPGNITEFKYTLTQHKYDLQSCTFDIKIPIITEEEYEHFQKDPNYFEKLSDDSVSDSEIDDFFKKLVFAVDQPNEIELFGVIEKTMTEDESINLLDKNFEINELYKQVIEWVKEKEGTYLTYDDCQLKVKQQMSKMELFGFKRLICEEIQQYGIQFQKKLTELQTLLNSKDEQILILENSHNTLFSAIKVYHTLMDFDEYKKVDSFIFLRHEMMKSHDVTKRVLEAFGSPHYSNLLVVECSANAEEVNGLMFSFFFDILLKNEKKKLVIITKKATRLPDTNMTLKIFEDNKNNLLDLTTESQRIIMNTKVNFQGHDICLDELISENSTHLFDGEILLQILKNEKINIGEKLSDLGEVQSYYVSRKLQEIKADGNFSGDFFKTQNSLFEDSVMPDQDIVLVSNEENEFEILCQKFKEQNIHWFKKDSKNHFWQKSSCKSMSKLRKCLVPSDNVIDFHEIKSKVVLISAPPGMGKSTELTNQAKCLKILNPNQWILRVNLIELSSKLHSLSNDFKYEISGEFLQDFFSIKQERHSSCLNNLENELFNSYYEQGQLVLLLDGFDEICPIYKDKVFELLKALKDSKVKKLFVTTRIYGILHELEDTLASFSYTFEDLKHDDKIKIMVGIWKTPSNLENFEEEEHAFLKSKAEKLLSLFDNFFCNNPLQIRMLAKAFQGDNDSQNQSMMKKIDAGHFNLADLYEHFFNILFDEIFIQEKNPGMHKDKYKPQAAVCIEEKRRSSIIFHKYLAPVAIFGSDVQKFLPEKFKNLASHFQEIDSGKYKMGLIEKITNGQPVFVHRTFAEYFCAFYLFDEENWFIPGFKKYFRKQIADHPVIIKFFGYLSNKNQRYVEKYPVHHAILQNNEAKLIHLIEKMKIKEKNCISERNLTEHDEFFQWSPLKCAAKLEYLGLIEILLKSGPKNKMSCAVMPETILMNAVTHDYVEILIFFDESNYLKFSDRRIFTKIAAGCDVNASMLYLKSCAKQQIRGFLLNLAAKNSALKIAKFLISKQTILVNYQNRNKQTPLQTAFDANAWEIIYLLVNQQKVDINVHDTNGNTPLHLAAEKGAFEIFKCIVGRENVNINAKNNDYQTPLHSAFNANAWEIIYFLINQPKVDINVKDRNGNTPLHLAASKGAFEIFKCIVGREYVNINAQNICGQTPLHLAARENEFMVKQIFIDQPNVNIHLEDKYGETPFDYALNNDIKELFKLFSYRKTADQSTHSIESI